ncbi:MAG: iron-sulfur cluster assembly protein, partial [Hyphomicrobiales bacterium]|nr:iron-sulfur cluster assembly protein [Hyphomicrobiales bacterium]
MASREQVLERLSEVKAPDGRPLPATGVLSDVVVSDGKVFFSLTVDAAAVPAWEPVRKAFKHFFPAGHDLSVMREGTSYIRVER